MKRYVLQRISVLLPVDAVAHHCLAHAEVVERLAGHVEQQVPDLYMGPVTTCTPGTPCMIRTISKGTQVAKASSPVRTAPSRVVASFIVLSTMRSRYGSPGLK